MIGYGRNGMLSTVGVTDLGEFTQAITIKGRGLLGCVVALHKLCGALHSNTV